MFKELVVYMVVPTKVYVINEFIGITLTESSVNAFDTSVVRCTVTTYPTHVHERWCGRCYGPGLPKELVLGFAMLTPQSIHATIKFVS